MNRGDVLDGRYALVRQIGAGGMGSVWEARDQQTDRRVALKILHEHLLKQKALVARFIREAHAAVEARWSGHIIEVLDVVHESGRPPYLVMEYLDGEDLEQILEREVRLEPRRAVDLIVQSCHAVAEVHRQDLVHRDVKPENLFVTRLESGQEWIKLLDFGVVKFSDGDRGPKITEAGLTVGTPHYMAPEQASSPNNVDHRVDIYALGVVLYEVLTGEAPYDAADGRDVMRLHLRGNPTPPREHLPELDPGLEAVVLRAMGANPKKRFQTVYDLAEALEPHREHASDGPRPRSVASTGSTVNDDLPASVLAGLTDELKTRKRLLAALVVGAALSTLVAVTLGVLVCRNVGAGATDAAPAVGDAPDPAAVDASNERPDDTEIDAGAAAAARQRARARRRINRRAVARALRPLTPKARSCLAGVGQPGTPVIVHYWITTNGTVAYRKSRPRLPARANRCLKRAARSHKLPRTGVPAFVATQRYRVPRKRR